MHRQDLDAADRELIASAADLVDRVSDKSLHTVACSMRTLSGRVFAGVNVFAQGGGAHAELVTLGMAISAGEKDMHCVVAVGDGARGVIPPCGLCRQLLVDYCPDATVIIPIDGVVSKVKVRDLLPYGPRSWFVEE